VGLVFVLAVITLSTAAVADEPVRQRVATLEFTCLLCTADATLALAPAAAAASTETGGGTRSGLPDGTAEPREQPLWIPTLVVGLGVAAAAAGSALLLLDGDCASTRVDAAGHCAQIHDLAPAGWSLVGVGAAAAVTGIVLLILYAGDETADSEEP
jgi:hypothetical protein